MLGRELRPGDVVAYPVRYASSMWTQVSLIDSVEDNCVRVFVMHENYRRGKHPSERTYPVYSLHRLVKLDMTEEQWRNQK